eukprot:12361235-Prorocentrum_lima.AAC.1
MTSSLVGSEMCIRDSLSTFATSRLSRAPTTVHPVPHSHTPHLVLLVHRTSNSMSRSALKSSSSSRRIAVRCTGRSPFP